MMTIDDWLFHGEAWYRYLAQQALSTVIATAIVTFVLTSAFAAIKRFMDGPVKGWVLDKLNPYTPGGVGDIPDPQGVPAHERLARASQTQRRSA